MIKFRTVQSALEENVVGQTFSPIKKDYRLNKVSDCLEECGTIDIDELVQSQKDVALNAMLDRFLQPCEENDVVSSIDILNDDLDLLCNHKALIERYKIDLGLSFDVSDSQVLNAIRDKKLKLEEVIKNKKVGIKVEKSKSENAQEKSE